MTVYFLAAGLVFILVLFVMVLAGRRDRRLLRLQLDGVHRELEHLMQAFSRFTPAGLVSRIIDQGMDIKADRRTVTVLFADIKGFTQLAEGLDPPVLMRVLGGYFAAMSEAITVRHGLVSRFIGDGLMALFGALVANPWQVTDAVEAALAMREGLARYNESLAAEGLPQIAIGIGIHHGEVVAGVVGARSVLQFDVHGDVVNLAARVESLTRVYATDLLVTDAVRREIDDRFVTREMAPAAVKGKSAPVITFAVEGPR